jgi:uncharacterized membrane protein YcfT
MAVLFFMVSGYFAEKVFIKPIEFLLSDLLLFVLYFLGGSYFFVAALGKAAS